jgi:hypothetical protein
MAYDTLWVFFNPGGSAASRATQEITLTTGDARYVVAMDLNGDQVKDLVVGCAGGIAVLINTRTRSLATPVVAFTSMVKNTFKKPPGRWIFFRLLQK